MAKSSIISLWRLFWTFGKPYRGHIVVGLLTGVLLGGSIFGLLQSFSALLSPFDPLVASSSAAAAPAVPGSSEASVVVVAPAAVPAGAAASAGAAATAVGDALPPAAAAAAAAADRPEVRVLLDRVGPVVERLGLGTLAADRGVSGRLVLVGAFGLLLFVVLRTAAVVANHYCLRWLGARIVVDLRQALLEALHRQSLSFFGSQNIGHLISRCTYDTARIEGGIASSIVDLSGAPFIITAALVSAVLEARRLQLGSTMVFFAIAAPLIIGPMLLAGRWVKR